jgi:hypothetical protein
VTGTNLQSWPTETESTNASGAWSASLLGTPLVGLFRLASRAGHFRGCSPFFRAGFFFRCMSSHIAMITESAHERIENFAELPKLLAREHELLRAWRAQGWRETGQPTRTAVDTWTGPR